MLTEYAAPSNLMYDFRRQLDRIFSDRSDEFLPAWPFSSLSGTLPASNICEGKDAWYVEMAAPGIKDDQVSLSVAGNDLTIQIQRPQIEETEQKGRYWRQERYSQSSSMSISLPNGVNTKDISAELDNGILVIRLPKTEVSQPKKINVKAKKLTHSDQACTSGSCNK